MSAWFFCWVPLRRVAAGFFNPSLYQNSEGNPRIFRKNTEQQEDLTRTAGGV